MIETRIWPTRSEWIAKAEQSVSTQCYLWQRVTADPAAWLTADELTEARALAVSVVKATRTALTKAGRANERYGLNSYGRDAAMQYADTNDLQLAWTRIIQVAESVQAAPQQTSRLVELASQMLTARDAAAEAALAEAIARTVVVRSSDEGWSKELERRASIEAGQHVTFYRI